MSFKNRLKELVDYNKLIGVDQYTTNQLLKIEAAHYAELPKKKVVKKKPIKPVGFRLTVTEKGVKSSAEFIDEKALTSFVNLKLKQRKLLIDTFTKQYNLYKPTETYSFTHRKKLEQEYIEKINNAFGEFNTLIEVL
jgi:hypothetical protein